MSISLWWKNLMCTPVCIFEDHLGPVSYGHNYFKFLAYAEFLSHLSLTSCGRSIFFLSFTQQIPKLFFSKFSKVQSKQGSYRRRLRVIDFYCWFGECLPWVTAQLIRLILDFHFLKSSLAILLLRTRPFVTFPWTSFPSLSFHLCTAQRRDIPLSYLSLKIKNSPHFLCRTIQCCLYVLLSHNQAYPKAHLSTTEMTLQFFSFFQSKDIFLIRRIAPPDFNPLPHPHPNILQDHWSV